MPCRPSSIAEPLDRLLDQRAAFAHIGDVAANLRHLRAARAQLVGDLDRLRRDPLITDHAVRALIGKTLQDCLAQPLLSPRFGDDDRFPTVTTPHHRSSVRMKTGLSVSCPKPAATFWNSGFDTSATNASMP